MQKLAKADVQALEHHKQAILKAFETLSEAIKSFNDAVATAWQAVKEAQDAYNEAATAFHKWRRPVGAKGRAYFDKRPTQWREGEEGQAYEEWIWMYDEFEGIALPRATKFNIKRPKPLVGTPEALKQELDLMKEELDGLRTEP